MNNKKKKKKIKSTAKRLLVEGMIGLEILSGSLFAQKAILPDNYNGINVKKAYEEQNNERYDKLKDDNPELAIRSIFYLFNNGSVITQQKLLDAHNKVLYCVDNMAENNDYFGAADNLRSWSFHLNIADTVETDEANAPYQDLTDLLLKTYKKIADLYVKEAEYYIAIGSTCYDGNSPGTKARTVEKVYKDAIDFYEKAGEHEKANEIRGRM